MTLHYYPSPYGELLLGAFQQQLVLCDWRYRKMRELIDDRIRKGLKASYTNGDTGVIWEGATGEVREGVNDVIREGETNLIGDNDTGVIREGGNNLIGDNDTGVIREGENRVIRETIRQLEEYFKGKREVFDLPLYFVGSDFQKEVWEALRQIPFGETRSYLELSRILGNENAIRAVASANGANAHAIIVPCHRVIGSKGELTGYAGGIATKRKLLRLESAGKEGFQSTLFEV